MTNEAWALTALAFVLSYLLGSVPTGLWLGLWLRGVDIRSQGSGNIGATNTLRVLGKKLGAAALAADAGKGLLAVLLVARLSPWPYAPLVCGLAAILGHVFSVFLRFRGGKGVATSAGVFLALCPAPVGIAIAAFIAVVLTSRIVSLGSVTAAVVLTAAVWLMPHGWNMAPPGPLLPAIVTALAAFIVYRHRGNIRRILRGEENRI
jgi:glycerol-3-phosphate acyltransferase PlsY